jgi:hypothetical protein
MSGENKPAPNFVPVDIEVLREAGCQICGGDYHNEKWTYCGSTTVSLCKTHWDAVHTGHLQIKCNGDALKCTHVENPENDPSTYPLQLGEPYLG